VEVATSGQIALDAVFELGSITTAVTGLRVAACAARCEAR
jgi:hypothetical protein